MAANSLYKRAGLLESSSVLLEISGEATKLTAIGEVCAVYNGVKSLINILMTLTLITLGSILGQDTREYSGDSDVKTALRVIVCGVRKRDHLCVSTESSNIHTRLSDRRGGELMECNIIKIMNVFNTIMI